MAKFNLSSLMNDKSKSEAGPVKEPFDIVLLPLDSLEPSEENKYGIRDIEPLAASIETVGLLHNLVVKKNKEKGKYSIISGERRYEALKLLVSQGKQQYGFAPCKIEGVEEDNPEINELRLLFANATARNLTDYEITYQAQRIKEILLSLKEKGYKFQGRMRQMVADLMEVSPAHVGRMEHISENLSTEFKEEFRDGNIGITAAYELSRLPREQQAQELTAYKQAGTVEIKGIQSKRAKPETSHVTAQNDISKATEHVSSSKEHVERLSANDIIRVLKAIAKDIESGNDGSSFDIHGACLDAANVIEDLINDSAKEVQGK